MQAVPREPRRARKERQDRGRIRRTERDLRTLRWIGEQYAIRVDHLQRVLGRQARQGTQEPATLGSETTRELVQRWKQAGLVESAVLVYTQPGWVWLTQHGPAQVELAYQIWKPKVQGLHHLYAINQVRLWVEEHQPAAIWRGERQLRHERGTVRAPMWQEHRPDAEVELSGQRVAIEVELSEKASGRLTAILYELARTYTGIWYFCSLATKGVLQRALAQLSEPARKKFSVIELSYGWEDRKRKEVASSKVARRQVQP